MEGEEVATCDTAKRSKSQIFPIGGTRLPSSTCHCTGWRASDEDNSLVEIRSDKLPDHLFVAMLDGHAGKLAAQKATDLLLETILEESKDYIALDPSERLEETGAKKLEEGVAAAYYALDDKLRKEFETLAGGAEGLLLKEGEKFNLDERHSGSTLSVTVITPSHFVFSSIGDCRILLARDGFVDNIFKDHKPNDPIEKERIEKAGGQVAKKRVDGKLAVSRALGDFYLKTRVDLKASEQKVSVEPECKVRIRTPGDEFLVVACDGVWDVLEPNAVGNFVHAGLKEKPFQMPTKDAKKCPVLVKIVEDLTDLCLKKGSRDNISCTLVGLNETAMKTCWENQDDQHTLPRSARWILHWTNAAVLQWLEKHPVLKPLALAFAREKVTGRDLVWHKGPVDNVFKTADTESWAHSGLRSEFDSIVGSLVMENEPEKAKWTVVQVSEWIGAAGHVDCAKLFTKHEVTGQMLMTFDKDSLKKVGLKKIGPRKKVWNIVEALQDEVFEESIANSGKRLREHSSSSSDAALVGTNMDESGQAFAKTVAAQNKRMTYMSKIRRAAKTAGTVKDFKEKGGLKVVVREWKIKHPKMTKANMLVLLDLLDLGKLKARFEDHEIEGTDLLNFDTDDFKDLRELDVDFDGIPDVTEKDIYLIMNVIEVLQENSCWGLSEMLTPRDGPSPWEGKVNAINHAMHRPTVVTPRSPRLTVTDAKGSSVSAEVVKVLNADGSGHTVTTHVVQ